MTAVAFYLLVLLAGLAGFAALVRLGMPEAEAWALGRTAGLVGVVLPAWWSGSMGLGGWLWIGGGLLMAGGAWGALTVWKRRRAWRELVAAEAVFVVGFVVVLLIRLGHPAIRGTEKPMDLGIFATLLRARTFPPPDMWLAGMTLPYYYWGALMWAVPLALSGLHLGVGYNLVAALVGGLSAAAVWALASRLARSQGAGLLAVPVALFLGTPDGLRQLLAGTRLSGLDFWASSRQIPHTITEFPLFTLWLGDLHPHLLSVPLALLAIALAAHAAVAGLRPGRLAAIAIAFGAAWAANPWTMPPTLAAVALMLLPGGGRRRWLGVAGIAVAGWLVSAPFQLDFHPPFHGFGLVRAVSGLPDFLLYAGTLVGAVSLAVAGIVAAWAGEDRRRRSMLLWGLVAATVVVAAASRHPVLVLLGLACAVLAAEGLHEGDPDRRALLLAALGVFLFLVPEILFVRDPYGGDLERMNTVFKSYFQAWILLAVAFPVLLRRAPLGRWLRVAAVVALLIPGLPHLVGMAASSAAAPTHGLEGLRWMAHGDRAAVAYLRGSKPGTTLVEAVGGAYTDYGRLSAASGVPTILGWANHELVWRGSRIGPEVDRRRRLVERIYTCGDPRQIRRLADQEGFDLIAVGDMERTKYPALDEEALRDAGEVVFERGDTYVVDMHAGRRAGAE